MNTGSIRWLAPRKHRRLLISAIALVVLSFPLLRVLSFPTKQDVLARFFAEGVLFVWVWTALFAMVLGFPVLVLQPVPWRRESWPARAYLTLVCLLFATILVLSFNGGAEGLRRVFFYLFWIALFLPKAIVLWTVPDVPGAWDFKAHARHP